MGIITYEVQKFISYTQDPFRATYTLLFSLIPIDIENFRQAINTLSKGDIENGIILILNSFNVTTIGGIDIIKILLNISYIILLYTIPPLFIFYELCIRFKRNWQKLLLPE